LPNFSDLGLSAPILGALAAEGYAAPTPIQFQAIPPVLGGRDLCGLGTTSETGRVTVRWPTGQAQQWDNLACDRYWRLTAGEATVSARFAEPGGSANRR